jgi:hypothetical protein
MKMWSISRPRHFTPRKKKPCHPVYRTLGGHWGRYGLLEGKNHLPLQTNELRLIGLPARSFITIPSELNLVYSPSNSTSYSIPSHTLNNTQRNSITWLSYSNISFCHKLTDWINVKYQCHQTIWTYGPEFLIFRFRLVSPYRTRRIFAFQSLESPGKYTRTLAMFAFVDPPESIPNNVLVTTRWGETGPIKCRFPVLCKCISKTTTLSKMRLLKWRQKIVHVWRRAVWYAEQSHRLKSTLYTLVTANTILTATYLWKVY